MDVNAATLSYYACTAGLSADKSSNMCHMGAQGPRRAQCEKKDTILFPVFAQILVGMVRSWGYTLLANAEMTLLSI